MALAWQGTETIAVDEQTDDEGDIVFTVGIRTHSRSALDMLSDLLQRPLAFRNNNDHDHINDD